MKEEQIGEEVVWVTGSEDKTSCLLRWLARKLKGIDCLKKATNIRTLMQRFFP